MSTTIQVSEDIRESLTSMKMHHRETYNEVIERLIEDSQEMSAETRREVKAAVKEISKGKYKTHAQVKRELGL